MTCSGQSRMSTEHRRRYNEFVFPVFRDGPRYARLVSAWHIVRRRDPDKLVYRQGITWLRDVQNCEGPRRGAKGLRHFTARAVQRRTVLPVPSTSRSSRPCRDEGCHSSADSSTHCRHRSYRTTNAVGWIGAQGVIVSICIMHRHLGKLLAGHGGDQLAV